jgi:hypothetical protein
MPVATEATSNAEAALRQRELAARMVNEKLQTAAQQLAERLGPAHGTKEVNWPEIIEMWEASDPDLDIEQAWDDAAKQAAMLIEKDKNVDPDKVMAEIPIEVARRYFPKREAAIKALGGMTYADWAQNAEEIEKRAAKVRVPPPPPLPEEQPLPGVDLGAISSEVAQQPAAPSETDPLDPMAPAGMSGESPSQLPGVGSADPLLVRAPGGL